MTYTPEQIQRVREILIGAQLGARVGTRAMVRCPFPEHNDGTPSLLIDAENAYHCFGCGRHGRGWIDFCKDMGFTFEQIMEEYG